MASPICQVKDGAGSYVGTTNGVDVTPGNTISIQLAPASIPGVTNWFLQVIGTDETTTIPALVGVSNLTNEVTGGPTATVTFTMPVGNGKAIGIKSSVLANVGPSLDTTFGVYSLTDFSTRVGFVTETREGDTNFGWATKVNPLIRNGGSGSGGPDNFSWKTIPDSKTVVIPEFQEMWVSAPITVDGDLQVDGDILVIDLNSLGGSGDPGPPGPAIVDAPYNKYMPALTANVDGALACSTPLTATPHVSGALSISVNGIAITNIGYGSTIGCACYWSNNGGVSSRLRANVAAGDLLYWNPTWAEFDLTTLDFLDFWYDIAL